MTKKRLLKDLPFGSLNAGSVLTKANGGYCIYNGTTSYGSDNGDYALDPTDECNIIDVIWENKEWFELATIDHVDIKAERNQITISFKPVDLEQAQCFAKGMQRLFLEYGKDGEYTWNEFADFTMNLT